MSFQSALSSIPSRRGAGACQGVASGRTRVGRGGRTCAGGRRVKKCFKKCSCLKPMLLREIHTVKQALKSGMNAQVIEPRVCLQAHHVHRVFIVSGLKPTNSLLFSAKSCVNVSHYVRRYVTVLCYLLQLVQDLVSFLMMTSCGICVSECSEKQGAPPES